METPSGPEYKLLTYMSTLALWRKLGRMECPDWFLGLKRLSVASGQIYEVSRDEIFGGIPTRKTVCWGPCWGPSVYGSPYIGPGLLGVQG